MTKRLQHIAEQFRTLAGTKFNQSDDHRSGVQWDAAGRLLSEAMDAGAWKWSTWLAEMRGLTREQGYGGLWIVACQDWLRSVSQTYDHHAMIYTYPSDYTFADQCRRIADAIEEDSATANDPAPEIPPKKSRRAQSRKPSIRQLEAVQLYGECGGNKAEAARRMGVSRAAFNQSYESGLRNSGASNGHFKPKTRPLPTDGRGQNGVSTGSNGHLPSMGSRRAATDKRRQ